MKTVTGEIVSSTPVTISKAASILSSFVSAETGASQAVTAYLRRATAAFDELNRLHSIKSDHSKNHKRQKSDATSLTTIDEKVEFERSVKIEDKMVNEVKEEMSEGERKKKKKKKKKVGKSCELGGDGDEGKMGIGIGIKKEEQSQVDSNLGDEIEGKKHKKKGNFEENGVEIGNKMKIKEEEDSKFEENGGKLIIEEEKKKRKSREVDEESSEKKKKKKRRKEETE